MAHNRDYKQEDIAFPEQIITQSDLIGEMEKSYLEYAMSVIVGRALPDVRDGLKPVHRRILYAMYEDGLTSDKPFKKSATCVGDVLGRYHPHGDASVYDAMVRLAQTFSMRYTLVEGHGNFGSVDGDPPAAYRYTEARMSKICNEMLRDIDKDTVDWAPNFDESRKEPVVLPSRFPNLLVNGSSGIAVGMATNIPPHNLGEVIDATVCLLENPKATLEELMEFLQGPDFPTKGIIIGRSGIRDAYKTGRGKIIVRARTHFEEFGKDKRTRIIVTELPYQVNKRQLIKNIGELVKDKRLEGISDLRDETDRNGMRIVIELKKDANEQVVLNHLLSQTQMQTSFSVIMLALVDNQRQPKVLTLHEVLREYIKFQEELLIKRIKFDLNKAKERAHLLEGLLKAQDNIDEVIRIIRSAYDDAKEQLCAAFNLDDVQAQAILDMRLKALQGLDREKLKNELVELEARIKHFEELLLSEDMLRDLLKEELLAIKERFADKRMTEISDSYEDIDDEDLIPRHTCIVTRTHGGYIKRLPADTYEAQNKGGKGIIGMNSKEEDYVEDVMAVSSHASLLMFTNKGKVQVMKCYKLPEGSRQAKGGNLVNMLNLDTENGEKVTNILAVNSFEEAFLTFVTKNGIIKRTSSKEFEHINKAGKRAISLDEGDELLYVGVTYGNNELLLATSSGKAVRFNENEARCMGRTARGVKAISLKGDDKVVGVTPVIENCEVLIMTENGYGKRSGYDEFRTMVHRGGMGVKCFNISEKTGNVVGIANIVGDEDILMITDGGQIIRTPVDDIVPHKRTAGGVIIMRLREGQKIASFTLVAQKVEVKEEEATEQGQEVPSNLQAENAQDQADENGTETSENSVETSENSEE